MKTTAWQLFNRNFKKDDEVIIIDDLDRVSLGSLIEITEEHFTLKRSLGSSRTRTFYWDQIRFMSHDGFPVKQLFGADGSATIEAEPNAKEVIRHGLNTEFGQIAFGDPFLIETVSYTLHNSGNDGPEFYEQDGEECLELVSKDGARGLLWHLPTVFYVEK